MRRLRSFRRPIRRQIGRACRASRAANCIPEIRAGLCLCRQNPADYAHDEARHDLCADTSASARPSGDAPSLTSCRPTTRS
ncbi:hypothetical protein DF027_04470 [Burkholderia cenocepacia]|nr:hypothetical protein DF028_05725 [Burkholderia cenocepacia]RQV51647.1 hypothetical protein DF027_04470 [Burkholderia cenocepacia]RQV79743.1 hypothetical protein DF010_10020 [Burkholderia cenocepacia]